MNAPQEHLGSLAWTEVLPTVSGDYFITHEGGSPSHKLIEVREDDIYWEDDDWNKCYFEPGCGWLFIGPLVFNDPTHFPVVTYQVETEDSQGNQTDV